MHSMENYLDEQTSYTHRNIISDILICIHAKVIFVPTYTCRCCHFLFLVLQYSEKKHELYENNVIFVQTSVVIVVFEKIITFNDNGCRKTLFLSQFVGAYTDLVVKNQIKREKPNIK